MTKNQVIKHLEMIQGVINRLGTNSFMLKGWSMTIIVGTIILMSRYELQNHFIILMFIIPVIGFWILDGYFLCKERLFRALYNEMRKQENTDFAMDIMNHTNEQKMSWLSSIFSITLTICYGTEVIFILSVFSIFFFN